MSDLTFKESHLLNKTSRNVCHHGIMDTLNSTSLNPLHESASVSKDHFCI